MSELETILQKIAVMPIPTAGKPMAAPKPPTLGLPGQAAPSLKQNSAPIHIAGGAGDITRQTYGDIGTQLGSQLKAAGIDPIAFGKGYCAFMDKMAQELQQHTQVDAPPRVDPPAAATPAVTAPAKGETGFVPALKNLLRLPAKFGGPPEPALTPKNPNAVAPVTTNQTPGFFESIGSTVKKLPRALDDLHTAAPGLGMLGEATKPNGLLTRDSTGALVPNYRQMAKGAWQEAKNWMAENPGLTAGIGGSAILLPLLMMLMMNRGGGEGTVVNNYAGRGEGGGNSGGTSWLS